MTAIAERIIDEGFHDAQRAWLGFRDKGLPSVATTPAYLRGF